MNSVQWSETKDSRQEVDADVTDGMGWYTWGAAPMRTIYILVLAIAFSTLCVGQSFDCKLAESPREHAVCADKELGVLDKGVSAAYKSLRAQLSPESAALVQSDQREWLHWLDLVCPAHGKGIADDMNRCLAGEYGIREDDLKQVVHVGSTVVFSRSRFLYETGSPDDRVTDMDPGFGYGSVRWPQIDIKPGQANAAYTEWNGAVRKRAAKLAFGIDTDDKNAFDRAVDASGTSDGYYRIEAANDRFIDVSFLDSSFGWGAAHPLTNQTRFLWWLEHNRELTASDVFMPNSDWKDRLAALTISNLRAQPDLKDMLDDDIEGTVKGTVSDFTRWSVSRDGVTITFGQYAIGPYAMGMPEAHISWSDLKAYLVSDFQPATLPAALHKPAP